MSLGGKQTFQYSLLLMLMLTTTMLVSTSTQALSLQLNGFNQTEYTTEQTVEFTFDITIAESERLSLQNMTLSVNNVGVCSFGTDATILDSCTDINITLIQIGIGEAGYGFVNFTPVDDDPFDQSKNSGNYSGYDYDYVYGYSPMIIQYALQIPGESAYFKTASSNDVQMYAQSLTQEFKTPTNKVLVLKVEPPAQVEQPVESPPQRLGGGSRSYNVVRSTPKNQTTRQIQSPIEPNKTNESVQAPLIPIEETKAEEQIVPQETLNITDTPQPSVLIRVTGAAIGVVKSPSVRLAAVAMLVLVAAFFVVFQITNKNQLESD